ncbi:hypothetical protein JQX13_18670 [Archangium violaceum]|nr:hypothetical protein [Archangium violaceum]QRK11898.1 hypothetical protein JQX13_18670 [Archangium violaceum]
MGRSTSAVHPEDKQVIAAVVIDRPAKLMTTRRLVSSRAEADVIAA